MPFIKSISYLSLFFLIMFAFQATAMAIGICVKPFTFPDRWEELTDPPFDPNTSTFDLFDDKGNPLQVQDNYIPFGQPGYIGYNIGTQFVIRSGNPGDKSSPSFYFALALPGGSGADWYRDNIQGCVSINSGDLIPVETGNMVGPTNQGVQFLIDLDPDAHWDELNNTVVNSLYDPFFLSPRIVTLALFDPKAYEEGLQHGRTDVRVASFIAGFIENLGRNKVTVRM